MNRLPRSLVRLGTLVTALAVSALLLPAPNARAHDKDDDDARIRQGFKIAPVVLDYGKKKRDAVGLGSYFVNTMGCNDCHTHPSYLPGHDPFRGEPEQINADQYLTGGRQFGPFTSANLPPDAQGNPAGLTFEEFRKTLRTGHDPDGSRTPLPPLLQVMPWPVYGKMIDSDLRAIYEYLRAIPSRDDNPDPGPGP